MEELLGFVFEVLCEGLLMFLSEVLPQRVKTALAALLISGLVGYLVWSMWTLMR